MARQKEMQFLSELIAVEIIFTMSFLEHNKCLVFQKVGGVRGGQLAQLRQGPGHLGNIAQLHEVCGLKQVRHSISSHLMNHGLDTIENRVLKYFHKSNNYFQDFSNTYTAPVCMNLLHRNRVEDNGNHQLGENAAILDPFVIQTRTFWLLFHDVHNPLQHFSFKLQIFLNR